MDRLKKLILKCNNCHNFYQLTMGRWSSLLSEFGSSRDVIKKYRCNKCIMVSPETLKRRTHDEHISQEEMAALLSTVNSKKFSPKVVIDLINKKSLFLVLHKSPKQLVRILTPELVDEIANELNQIL